MKIILLGQLFLSIQVSAFCVQSYNAYGPAYARNTIHRTQMMVSRLKKMDSCEVLQFQEVWSSDQAQIFLDQMPPFQKTSAPNLKLRLGLMGFYQGESLGSFTHVFPLNNDGGLLDGVREAFSVMKGFQVESISLEKSNDRSDKIFSKEPIYFINTHLHPSSVGVRLAQLLELYQWRLHHLNQKLVLTGDFNFETGSLERRIVMGLLGLRDSAYEVWGSYSSGFCTYCEENPLRWMSGNHVFDYVFYSNFGGNEELKLSPRKGEVNFKADDGEFLSDHYGLRLFFNWQERNFTPEFDEKQYKEFLNDLFIMNKVLKNEPDYFIKYRKMAQDIYLSLKDQRGLPWEYYKESLLRL